MPRARGSGLPLATSSATPTPSALLRDAEKALESGERRQRNGEEAKAVVYFQTTCCTLADVRDDRVGCLLWATAMANLVELGASSWSGSTVTGIVDLPDLHLAASALERGHAAAVAAGAPNDERAHLLSARAQCAELLRESLTEEWTRAVPWAAEAARLWEETLTQELAAQSVSGRDVPEASSETLCNLGSSSMAFGKLVLTHDTEDVDATARRAAQAAVKRALDAFEEACGVCDSTYTASAVIESHWLRRSPPPCSRPRRG